MNSRPGPLIFLLPSLAGGGAERVASLLLPHLVREFNLRLVLLENRCHYPLPPELTWVAFSGALKGPVFHVVNAPVHFLRLWWEIRRRRARMVLSFMPQANLLNLLVAHLTGHKAVISERVHPVRHFRGKGVLGWSLLRACRCIYPCADQAIAVSGGIRDVLVDNYRLSSDRVAVIPNPVDADRLRQQAIMGPPPGTPAEYILHVGRLRLVQKGQDVALQAFHRLSGRWPRLHLVFVGEGPDRAALLALRDSLGLRERVLLLPWQSNVASLMAGARAFVLSSRYEGWPNALVEAMACGCAVVAADCETGPRAILGDSHSGLLVPPGDVAALASALDRLLTDAALAGEYRRSALRRARQFEVRRIATRYADLLKGVLAGGAPASRATPGRGVDALE